MHDTTMWPLGPLTMLLFAALIILPFCLIFKKAGYSQWLGLLMIVPLVNLILLYFLALSTWPRDKAEDSLGD
ncbi:hypothetical protein [Pseudomonas benzenivorans]|uniref:Uncharacterized protein n=1 Tax=Pseudomonas benzenivorans TaxID=556533 RepID=A0ABY5H2L3_9PSED|nr:hypothetical protein [Pseudomonas benzenivorans]UTW06537.1 hypothetical protein KDW96_15315 [Pseudomonas benzenivorans]